MGKRDPSIATELDTFGFLIRPAYKRLIRLAARKLGLTLAEFARRAVVDRAKQVLTEGKGAAS
jgi:uncharacterized protein (DUF1778 family)